RNAKSHAPRSASVAQYHSSTGFEALLGYLYLMERSERLYELAEESFRIISKAMMDEISNKK
ncbi:MAG TPA: ribonuclease III, partial [Anaerovibrio sp.]|nr:ribonuclease III [Anaerovibrio sp.]